MRDERETLLNRYYAYTTGKSEPAKELEKPPSVPRTQTEEAQPAEQGESTAVEPLINQISALQTVIEDLQKQEAKWKKKLSIQAEEYKKTNQSVITATKKAQLFYQLGFLKPEAEQESPKSIYNDKQQLSKQIRGYLRAREHPLYLSAKLVDTLVCGLCSNQLILLYGPSGSGKTSLLEGVAEAISAKIQTIPVMPTWKDRKDLLGYYSSAEKEYIPTQFLDTVIEASEHPETLYFICLDECSLAPMEAYFSDFLSLWESKKQPLYLYSEQLFELLQEEASLLKSLPSDQSLLLKDREYQRLKRQFQMAMRYPPKLLIPENIRFFGTISQIKQSLSSRVIDRSFIICMDDMDREQMISRQTEESPEYVHLPIEANPLTFSVTEGEDFPPELLYKLRELGTQLQFSLSARFEQQAREILGSHIDQSSVMIDTLISCKILPRIDLTLRREERRKIIELERLLEQFPVSEKTVGEMMKKWEAGSDNKLSYWQ